MRGPGTPVAGAPTARRSHAAPRQHHVGEPQRQAIDQDRSTLPCFRHQRLGEGEWFLDQFPVGVALQSMQPDPLAQENARGGHGSVRDGAARSGGGG